MYIAQAFNILHDWWRYLIGVVIAIAGVFAFSLPHLIAIGVKTASGNVDQSKLDDLNYLTTLFESNVNLVLILLPFAGGLFFLLLASRFLHKQSFTHLTTSRKKIDWKRVFFAFFLWGILSSSLVILDYFFYSPDNYILNFKLQPFIVLCIIAIILVPLQTSFEEYLFRGYLMQGIGIIVKNKWFPLLLTSFVFGLLHISNPEVDKIGNILMVYYIGTGLFLGIITLMDEGLELALGFHAANNLFTALLVTTDWTVFQTHSVLKDISDPTEATFLQIFIPVFVIFPILILIFAKKYKWSNWKSKLFGRVEKQPQEDYKILE